MKYSILPLILLAFACAKPTDLSSVAKDSATAFLKNHMNDPKSYEPIEWGKLDTVFSEMPFDADEYMKIRNLETDTFSSGLIIKTADTASSRYKEAFINYTESKKTLMDMKAAQQKREAQYKPKLMGYSLNHKLRAKNGFGAMMLFEKIFVFDSTMKVIDMIDAKEKE